MKAVFKVQTFVTGLNSLNSSACEPLVQYLTFEATEQYLVTFQKWVDIFHFKSQLNLGIRGYVLNVSAVHSSNKRI